MGTPEIRPFQAEVRELLGLMIHSLYSHQEIFLRELLSNAADALDKLRVEALTTPGLVAADERLHVRLEVERHARTLSVIDNGIGMSRAESIENLGTIARSGTRKFLDALREKGASAPELIGRFGVGFYASFMVADEITVDSARAGGSGGARWISKGDGQFTVEDLAGLTRGTRITLRLKALDAEDPEAQDFADPHVLRALVRKYSDFVEWPIEMSAEGFPGAAELPRERTADGTEVVVLNSRKPLWARAKDEITAAEHALFFRHLTHSWSDPLAVVHFKGEGTSNYTALLYVPGERPLELFDPARDKVRVQLYVRRVFVTAECAELLPPWLRFVRGVVDSSDLPLNVSREILQHNRALAQIHKRLVKKTLDALAEMLRERRADYLRFWSAFGAVLKEGLVTGAAEADAIAGLALYESSRDGAPTTLDEYVARMPNTQTAIYVLAASDAATARRSPLLEAATARGFEVLFWTDPIDEWVLEHRREHAGKPIACLDRAELDLASEAEKFERERKEREFRAVLERLESELAGRVAGVRFSSRLKDSPAVLVDDEHAPRPFMERLMRESGRPVPERKRILELNADHPLTQRLKALHDADAHSPRIADWSELLLGQALLAEGSPLPDPTRFGKLVSELMLAATP